MWQIQQLCIDPAVYMIDGFLSADECQALIDVALKKRLTNSLLGYFNVENHERRKSKQVFIRNKENILVTKIKNRINRIIKLPSRLQEPLQIVRYTKTGFFHCHHDFDLLKTKIADRLVTFMIYLNDVEKGGETEFPDLNIRVIPKQGRALLWYNYTDLKLPEQLQKSSRQVKVPLTLEANYKTQHAGLPVKKGEKWIANQWYSFTKERGEVIKDVSRLFSDD